MDRIITTHGLRKVCEPTPVWTLTTLDPGGLAAPVNAFVPGAWESIPGLKNYRGRAVYEKQLNCGGTLRFVFGGVSSRAKVCLDDRLLVQHHGAHTAFDCLAEDVPFDQHTLRVEVDHPGDDASCSCGGITRPVTIEQLGSAYVTLLRVTPKRRGRIWQARMEVTVRSLSDANQVIDVDAKAGPGSISWKRRSLPARGEITLAADLLAPGVTPWTPENPRLYTAEAVLWLDGEPADDLRERFGFREIKAEDGKLLLNGKPIFIKGVNRHEEYASFGCAVPVEVMAQDVSLIKDLGCNLVRAGHHPFDPRFRDLCDQYGLMIWQDDHAQEPGPECDIAFIREDEPSLLNDRPEEQQAAILRERITSAMAKPEVNGIILPLFADIQAEEGNRACHAQPTGKGLVDAFRRPRLSYATVKELFRL